MKNLVSKLWYSIKIAFGYLIPDAKRKEKQDNVNALESVTSEDFPKLKLTEKEYLDWKFRKCHLETSIAYAKKKIFECQDNLAFLQKVYKKRGFSQYPLIIREEVYND